MTSRPSVALRRFIQATAAATFGLLVAGGLVTSTDSGLAVPDWPLSYGMWFPPMVGGIRYEHGHRMIAAVVGVMILVMAVWLRIAEPRRWVRRLGYAALLGVIAQAILGGLTVLLVLPPPISIAHACLGPAVFCIVVALARATSPAWVVSSTQGTAQPQPAIRALSLAAAALAGLQLFLGAIVRHTGAFLWWHVAGAGLLAVTVGRLLARTHRAEHLPHLVRGAARLLGALVLLQVILGLLTFWHWGHVGLVTAHTALGTLILAQAVLLALQSARHFSPEVPGTLARKCQALFELTKPRLAALVLVTTAAGFWLGLRAPQAGGRIIPLLIGTGLVVGGANALNQWMERELDARMQRTRSRPLPSGRLQPEAARRFGLALIAGGMLLLGAAVNWLAAALALLSAASYLFLYTPMKRTSPLCTLVGAIPGALPPLIGWVGAQGSTGVGGWVLFMILFVWQLPHFLAIAWMYRDDFARAAFRFLPVVDPSGSSTSRQVLWSATALVPISLLPTMTGVAGSAYFYGALALGLGFLAVSVAAAMRRSVASARRLFLSSVGYLPLLLLLLSADKVSHASPALAGLPVHHTVPSFALVDQAGRPLTRETLRGSVWVADFIFTRCAGQCPIMSRRMAELQAALADLPQARLVSFTVDPAYDTPGVLARYGTRFGAQPDRWVFATGEAEAIVRLAQDGFRLSVADGGPPEEPITHSVRLVLVDQAGRIRGTYDATDPAAIRQLDTDVRKLLARP